MNPQSKIGFAIVALAGGLLAARVPFSYGLLVFSAVLFVGLAFRCRRNRRTDLFEPGFVIPFVYLACYGIPAISPILYGNPRIPEKYFLIALGYACLSLLLFALAYHSRVPRTLAAALPRAPEKWNRTNLIFVIAVFSAIGFGGYFLAMRSVGGLGNYLTNLGDRIYMVAGKGYLFQLRNFALAASMIWFVSLITRTRPHPPTRREWLLFATHWSVLMMLLLPLGSRGTVLTVFLWMLIAWNYAASHIRFRTALVFVVFATAFTLVYGTLRSISIYDIKSVDSNVVFKAMPTFFSGGLADGTRILAGTVEALGRDVPYQLGSTYGAVMFFPIPRSLFDRKPRTGGEVVTEEVFADVTTPGTEYLTPNILGEAYLNWSAAGIVLVSLLYGLVAGTIYQYMRRHPGNPSVAVIAPPLLTTIYLFPGGEFINSVSDLIKVAIIASGVLLVAVAAKVRMAHAAA